VAAIEPSVQRAEALRASSKPTTSLDAYDCYLRAVLHFHTRTQSSLDQAVAFLRDAVEHDSGYALAKGFLAYLYTVRNAFGWGAPDERDSAVALVREALATAPDDPLMARWIAHPLVYFIGDFDRALLIVHQAEKLAPHFAQLLRTAGLVHLMRSEPAEAIDYYQRAIRLSPVDPEMPIMQMEYGMALVIAGNDEEALNLLNQAVTQLPDLAPAYRFMIIALWRLNRFDEMRVIAASLMKADPGYRISTHVRPNRDKHFLDLYERALRAADLPD
jgi:adenylate cyclase